MEEDGREKEEEKGGLGFTMWRGRDWRMEEEEEAAAAEAEVGEGGEEGWWRRRSRPPASRHRCTRSASMARGRGGEGDAEVECGERREGRGECLLLGSWNALLLGVWGSGRLGRGERLGRTGTRDRSAAEQPSFFNNTFFY